MTHTPDQVRLDIRERRSAKSVRWQAFHDTTLVAAVRVPLVDGRCDTEPLVVAIAEHFGVDETAVAYQPGPNPAPRRLVLARAVVTVPPKPTEPQRCAHLAGDAACGLASCDGTPDVTTPLERDVAPIPTEATASELGVYSFGREVMKHVAISTGMPVADGFVGSTAWSERPGVRRIDGWWFDVGGIAVRVLAYDSRESTLEDRGRYMAVYLDQDCVLQQRNPRIGQVIVAIEEAAVVRHDARVLAVPPQRGWWRMKNPPIGFNVDHPEYGVVEVHEESTNGGSTLRVIDAAGTHHFLDRRREEFWTAAYGGMAIGGHDTWARYRRRVAYSHQVIAYRHRAHQHGGPAEHCPLCPGEVAGAPAGTNGHLWGRYVVLPCCPKCGLSRSAWENATDVGQCPGSPRQPDTDHEPAATGQPAQAPPPVPVASAEVGRRHVRAGFPVTVDLGGGRQGLANPCWCGRIDLPDGDQSAHVYGLAPDRVTCPVCHHLFTCPWAQLKDVADRAALCKVCAHIDGCEDPVCDPKDHPGIVPEPDPTFEYTTGAAALVDRIHQAVREGDLELADKLIRAGENYEPGYAIDGQPDGWDGLSMTVWKLRRHAQQGPQLATPPADDIADVAVAADAAADPHADACAGWAGLFAELGI